MEEDEDEDAVCWCGAASTYEADGLTYCSNDHRLERGPEHGEDEDDYYQRGHKVTSAREKAPKKKLYKVYHGQKAFRLYIQVHQYLVWQQCYKLIHDKNLPPELWTVVRDLWTLRLPKLVERLEVLDSRTADPTMKTPNSSGADAEVPGAHSEQITVDVLEQRKVRARNLSSPPRLIESICLCYLGILLLRLDTSLGDVHRWTLAGDLVYHRAINSVPHEMLLKLPGEYHEALDTAVLLKPDDLHRGVAHLITLYTTEYAMVFPSLNSSLLLFKYIKRLALPIEVFPAVQKLNDVLKFSFSFSSTTKRKNQSTSSFPEVRLMALAVIVTKLFYPLEGSAPCPRTAQEPAAQHIDWPQWVEVQADKSKQGEASAQGGQVYNVQRNEDDALRMTGEEVDKYLDWYQQTWAKTDMGVEGAHKEILDLFPLLPSKSEPPRSGTEQDFENEITATLVQSQSLLVNNEVIIEEEAQDHEPRIERPGSSYKTWRTKEDLSPTSRVFIGIAADTIGVSVHALLLGVAQIERAIGRWKESERRREAFPDGSSNSENDDEAVEDHVGAAVEDMARMSIDGDIDHEMDVDA